MYSPFDNTSSSPAVHIKKEYATCGEIRTAFELGKRWFTFNCMFCGEQFQELEEFSIHLDDKHLEEFSDCMVDNYSQNEYEENSVYNTNICVKEEIIDAAEEEETQQQLPERLQTTSTTSQPSTARSKEDINPAPPYNRRPAKVVKRNKYSPEVRRQIMEAAACGLNWVQMAAHMGVAYKTAWHWINSGRLTAQPKGGNKPRKLNDEIVEIVLTWLESNNNITLQEIANRIEQQFGISLTRSSVGNYLSGMLYVSRIIHVSPEVINTPENKFKRTEFVTDLLTFSQMGKEILWLDEVNFNLFSTARQQKLRQTSSSESAALAQHTRLCNLHLIGAISNCGSVAMNNLELFDKAEGYNTYIRILLSRWHEMGYPFKNLLIICDKTFSYTAVETVVSQITNGKAKVMRLEAYTPMLNPMETIWSKMKNYVKTHLMHQPQESNEQRMIYLQQYINEAWVSITQEDCAQAIEFSSSFHADALAMRDMNVVKL